jgi:hypothetical protein
MDRSEKARLLVVQQGVTFIDVQGSLRKNPAVDVEMDAKINFARLLILLGLPNQEPTTPVSGVQSHKGKTS